MISEKKLKWLEDVLNKPRTVGWFSRLIAHLRRNMIAGLVTVMPIAITIAVSYWVFAIVTKSQWVRHIAKTTGIENTYLSTALTILAIIIVVYLLGLLSTTMLAKILLRISEKLVGSVPLVKSIYALVKQIVDAFKRPEGNVGVDRKVVLVEYPRIGCLSLGFVTAESVIDNVLYCHVLVLTTPNPTSGWVLFLKSTDVNECGMTPDEGMKFILSGGIVSRRELHLTPYKPSDPHVIASLERIKEESVASGTPVQKDEE